MCPESVKKGGQSSAAFDVTISSLFLTPSLGFVSPSCPYKPVHFPVSSSVLLSPGTRVTRLQIRYTPRQASERKWMELENEGKT